VSAGPTVDQGLAGAARYAGSRVHRVEDARLLTGRGTYVDDVQLPAMLHACFVRSPYARARIVDIDPSEALTLAGVRAVFVAADLNPPPGEGQTGRPRPRLSPPTVSGGCGALRR
jgi:carbon-monoxide dehydrogenase large subunit